MDSILHARMPGEASWDGLEWKFRTVCGRVAGFMALALHAPSNVTCGECLADLGLGTQMVLPGTHPVSWRVPAQAEANPMA